MKGWKRAAEVVAGTSTGAVAAGVAAERYVWRLLRGQLDPDTQRRFHEARGRQLTVTADDGVPLYVEIDGDDDAELTIVFCHGWTLQHASWYYQREALGDLGRLVFWDQCDHGQSGRRQLSGVSVEATGEDLRAVLDAVAPDGPVVLVGHSMGGMTIMALASRYPELFGERVSGVALISTGAGGLGELAPGPYGAIIRGFASRYAGGLAKMIKPVERARAMGRMMTYFSTWRLLFGPGVGPDLVTFVEGMIRATPIDVVSAYYPVIAGHNKLAALEVFRRVPTMAIAGTEDKLISVEASHLMASVVPNVELVEVAGAGHMVMLEAAEVVGDALQDLVKRARPVTYLEGTA